MPTSKEIAAEIKRNTGAFAQGLLDQVATRANRLALKAADPLPQMFWHYTASDVPAKILSSSELWAVDFRRLNDSSEVMHLRELTRVKYRDVASGPIKPKRNGRVDCESADHAVELALRHALYGDFGRPAFVPYIVSLSESDDDLQQWRSYARDARGVAIGFRAEALLKELAMRRSWNGKIPQFWRVIYDDAVKMVLVGEIVDTVSKGLRRVYGQRKWAENAAGYIAQCGALICVALEFYGALCKHRGFRSETEWRIVLGGPPDAEAVGGIADGVKLRARPGGSPDEFVLGLGVSRSVIETIQPGPRCAVRALKSEIDSVLGPFASDELVGPRSTIPYLPARAGRRSMRPARGR